MTDPELVAAFTDGTLPPDRFHHREHLLVAWSYLRADPFDVAAARFCAALRRYAEAHGAARKYDEALTRAYLARLDARRRAAPPAASFDELLAAHPDLLDRITP